MKTTIDMSSYEVEQDAMEMEYGEEIMCAGWNPAVDLVCEGLTLAQVEEQTEAVANLMALTTPDEVSSAVSELFMRKMYSYQR